MQILEGRNFYATKQSSAIENAITYEFISLDDILQKFERNIKLSKNYTTGKYKRYHDATVHLRAFYPKIFPYKKIAILDVDVELRSPIQELYKQFENMNSHQIAALAYDQTPYYRKAFKGYRLQNKGTKIGCPSPGYQQQFSFLGGYVQSCKDCVLATCSTLMFENKIIPESGKEAAATMLAEEVKRMRISDPDDDESSRLSGDGSYEFSVDESDSSQSSSAVKKGFNTGVMLFDLEKTRKSMEFNNHLTESGYKFLFEKYNMVSELGDQDFFTLLGAEYPGLFYVLDCSFNRQMSPNFYYNPLFDKYHRCDNDVKIYHGNGRSTIPRREEDP
ncbi:hypothetical protein QYM36_018528 [Artemia franciscana]|uniref:Uncharacterized protein n=1 Tax=Artemia franciscana TaxID=6661 RepID=A0AA88HC82_ARTSF|nr:hypothetical protein QYM36_018528 [Artemia franciscana]